MTPSPEIEMSETSVDQALERAWESRRAALGTPEPGRAETLRAARDALLEVIDSIDGDAAPARRARAQHYLAHIQSDLGLADEARASWQASVELLRHADDPPALAHRLRHLGDALRAHGDLDAADRALSEALTLVRSDAQAAPLEVANTLYRMALLREAQGRMADARAHWLEVRDAYRDLGISEGVADAESRLSMPTPPDDRHRREEA